MIEVRDLHKAFGTVKAVDGVSFTARDGEITGLLGPNGAGKTTTLRMPYTLMAPDRGQVLVDGIDAAVDPLAVRRQLGVLPDARGLYKRLTARENIDYFARLHGLPEDLLKSRRDALIEALEMSDIADRRVTANPYDRAHRYRESDWFVHPRFGVGQVKRVTPDGAIDVLFEDGTTKKMLHAHTS